MQNIKECVRKMCTPHMITFSHAC